MMKANKLKVKKYFLMLLLPALVLAGQVFAYTGEDPNALEVYNRTTDWVAASHTIGTNSHGHWSYHMMTKADIDAYGRGDDTYWTACDYIMGSDLGYTGGYRFRNELPKYVQVGAWETHIAGEWNKSTNDDLDYRESEMAVVFTAPENGNYNVVGDLYWSNEHLTDPRAYVHIGTVKSGVYTNIWSSEMLRGPGGDYTQMIDPANPEAVPGFTDNAALKDIRLDAGEQLLIILQTGLLNYRKTNLHDSAVYIERNEVGPLATYNRNAAWTGDTHTDGENSHGNWSYHMIMADDVAAYGRGDSTYWVDMGYLSATDKYQYTEPLPAYWLSEAYSNLVKAMWNKSDNDHLDFREAEMAMVFTVPAAGEYDVVGQLKWSNYGSTDTRATVHVGTIKAGEATYNNVWSSVLLRDDDNLEPYTMIPEESPVDVPGYTDNQLLKGIPLSAGDMVVITLQTGVLNYRGAVLHDEDVVIKRWPVDTTVEFVRSTDFISTTKSGNSHGTIGASSADAWKYWIKPFAFDRLDYLPGELEALNYDVGHGRFELYDPVSWWDYHTFADSSTFETVWNTNGVDYGKQSWVVATFKNPYPATVDFSITGETTWEMERTGTGAHPGIVKCEVAVISSDFSSKSTAWSWEESVNGAVGTYPVPDPALYSVPVGPGEYIAIGFRGNRYNYRNAIWHNSALTISADESNFANVEVQASPSLVNSGITPAIGVNPVISGSEIDLIAEDFAGACPTGWMFDHWEVDSVFYSSDAETTLLVDADTTVVAVFVESNVCGDVCRPYPYADISEDCEVDFDDFRMLAEDWGQCTDPSCD